jgi:hypothetical protein
VLWPAVSANLANLYRHAAGCVDKILKGWAKPADISVQQPTTFDLALNLQDRIEIPACSPLPTK